MSTSLEGIATRQKQDLALQLISAENRVLELIATGTHGERVLEAIALETEKLCGGSILCSVLLLDETGTTLLYGAAPSLPRSYNAAIHGLKIGPEVGSCGTAAFRKQRVIVTDIHSDPLWQDFRELAGGHGLRACWSTPILGPSDELLGTFALYSRECGAPSERDLEIVTLMNRTAAIAIQHSRTQQKTRSFREQVELLNQTGLALAAEHDLEKIVQAATDAATKICGAEFGAFFYNVINAQGESYMLYTISGVPREAFSKFPMPRNTAVFAPTFAGEGIVRSDDITKDPRYGKNTPRKGMPEGHLPVRSYLAVPVISRSGIVHGGLFFGHSRTGVFKESAEQLVVGIAAQAAIAIDNARLHENSLREIRKHEETQQRLALVQQTAQLATWEWELTSGQITSTPGSAEVFGVPWSEIPNITAWKQRIHQDHREKVWSTVQQAIQTGNGYDVEYRTLDPGSRWVLGRGHVVRDSEGRPQKMLVSSVDITAQKQAEAALQDAQQQFRTLADTIPNLAWMANGDGWIFWYNHRWYEYTGTTPEQMQGWGWQSVHDPQVLPSVLERWTESIRTGQPFDMVFPLRGVDGIFRQFLTRVMPVHDAEGRVVRWFGTNTDIDSERKKEEALRESEEKFRSLSISSPVGIFLADVEGSCLYTNPRCQNICGFPSMEESLGQTWAGFIHPEDAERVLRTWREATRQRREWHQEFRWGREPGRVRWTICRGAPIVSDRGEVTGYVGTVEDITERKLAENALLEREELVRRSQERLRAALAASSTGTFRWNPHTGEFMEFDANLKRLFGFAPGERVRTTEDFISRVHPDDLATLIPAIEHCARDGADFEMEYRVVLPTGEVRWLYDRAKMEKVDGKPTYLVGACTDITDRKLAQEALIESEKLASVGRLAATVAHEINNPLEAVTNYIYLAKNNRELPEKVRKHLMLADQELARVTHIAQQTLGFYRDNSRPVVVSIPDAINDVLTIYERKFSYKRLSVERELNAPLQIETLQGELKQALSNLIANAIDASPNEGRIIVRARQAKRWKSQPVNGVRITIADTGCGMSAEVQRKIFTPFFTTKKEVGTGLGLWVTRNIVEKQKGYVRFRSREGRNSGTVMSIFLPLQKMFSQPS